MGVVPLGLPSYRVRSDAVSSSPPVFSIAVRQYLMVTETDSSSTDMANKFVQEAGSTVRWNETCQRPKVFYSEQHGVLCSSLAGLLCLSLVVTSLLGGLFLNELFEAWPGIPSGYREKIRSAVDIFQEVRVMAVL